MQEINRETPMDGMLSALVWDYLRDKNKSIATEFFETVKPPLLVKKSPGLRDILQFYMQRSRQSVAVMRRLKEHDNNDPNQPEKHWAVCHDMRYIQIAVESSATDIVRATLHDHPETLEKKKTAVAKHNQNIQTDPFPPIEAMKKREAMEAMKKSTPMVVKKDVSQKSKLTSKKKSALVKDMIKKQKLVSVVKKKFPKAKM